MSDSADQKAGVWPRTNHHAQRSDDAGGVMMGKWRKMKLGEICKFKYGEMPKQSEMRSEGYPVYSGYRFVGYSSRYHYREPEIIVVARGEGGTGDIKMTPQFCFLTNISIVLLLATPDVLKSFLFYRLSATTLWELRTGSAQAQITIEHLKEYEVEVPPLPVQRRIAGILSAYDELIENSQRRIRILEAMARALYREWFVYFRFPGHDNSAGAPNWTTEGRPEGVSAMDGANQKLPRVASPLGDIPQGWEVKTLCQIAENFDRLRKPLSKMQRAEIQGQFPYYGAAKVFDYINDFIFEGEYLLMAEDGSVITTERAPVLQLVNEKFWPNNHTHVLHGKPPFSTHFLYLGLSEVDISPYITGAAQPKITQENMNRIPFFCGPEKLHQEFNRLVAPMIRKSQLLQRQIQNLRRTRDLLLPRLLSGDVDLATSFASDSASADIKSTPKKT